MPPAIDVLPPGNHPLRIWLNVYVDLQTPPSVVTSAIADSLPHLRILFRHVDMGEGTLPPGPPSPGTISGGQVSVEPHHPRGSLRYRGADGAPRPAQRSGWAGLGAPGAA